MACRIWQLAPQTHTQMMGYVLLDDGGELVVIDGGTAGDAAYLMHLLRRVAGPKPRIRAWFLTHPHSDHVNAFLALWPREGIDFTVDGVYLRFPARQLLERGEPGCLKVWDAYEAIRPTIGAREHPLREGDRLTFGGMAFQVLYVTDPTLVRNASNNSSCVLRLTAAGASLLFLGDLGAEGGEILLNAHGEEVQSDAVQMAHHGQSAVRMDVYDAVRPRVCLWCAPRWLWDNDQGHRGYDSGVWDILRVRAHMARLGVRRHVIAKDGTALITLADGRIDAECWDPYAAL